ncbi:ATP-binding protein [Streptococcus sanguinis]|uniref:ATP-binding protein n=1 Tax=Streptococcus sanguinis TaxID=1305 RepID=A0A7Y0VB02_STRSA|nr:ATP-binding protein [Streptococcus sanguinis]
MKAKYEELVAQYPENYLEIYDLPLDTDLNTLDHYPSVWLGKRSLRRKLIMRLKQIKIKNFRGYKDETIVDFDNLTAFIGKNDAGKSTILEALEIFFNNKLVVCER